jgi:hypothetical protein
MIAYVQGKTFLCMVAGDGGPLVLHRGERFEPVIPQDEWNRVLAENHPRAGFDCNRRNEPVFSIDSVQACRCTRTRNAPGYEFTDGQEWAQWQRAFDRELNDAAPTPYWVEPVVNSDGGATESERIMTPAAKVWFKRKFGLPANLEISDDGHSLRLPGDGGGVIQVGKDGNLMSVYDDADESDGHELYEVARKLNAVRESFPPMMIILGDDNFYVWPPFVDRRSIRSLPFSCTRCGKRVKRAPLFSSEVLVCFCMMAGFGPDSKRRPPRSRVEWDTLRIESATKKARVKTQLEGVRN